MKNDYVIDEEKNLAYIKLTRKFDDQVFWAVIDLPDLDRAKEEPRSWYVKLDKKTGKILRVSNSDQIALSLFVQQGPSGSFVFHQDGNPLNCCRNNVVVKPRGLHYRIDEENQIAIFEMIHQNGTKYETTIDLEDLPRVASNYRQLTTLEQIGEIPRAYGRLNHGDDKWVYLHRFIMNAPSTHIVDHVNNNPLDNRKDNLRLVDMSANMQNRRGATKRSKTGIRGVHWDKSKSLYVASVQVDNVCVYRHYFKTIEEAETAVKVARARHMPYSKEAEDPAILELIPKRARPSNGRKTKARKAS